MNCIEYSELISAYVDGMLNPQEEEKLMKHLKMCKRCNQDLRNLKQLQKLCSQMEEVSLPDTFHTDLMKRIKIEKKVKPLRSQWKWQYSGALVATVLIGIVFWNQLGFITSQNERTTEYMTQGQVAEARIQDETSAIAYENHIGSRGTREEINPMSIWKVQVESSDRFIEAFKTYLEEQQIVYELTESGIIINQISYNKKLINWLKAHSLCFEGEKIETKGNIELIIEQK